MRLLFLFIIINSFLILYLSTTLTNTNITLAAPDVNSDNNNNNINNNNNNNIIVSSSSNNNNNNVNQYQQPNNRVVHNLLTAPLLLDRQQAKNSNNQNDTITIYHQSKPKSKITSGKSTVVVASTGPQGENLLDKLSLADCFSKLDEPARDSYRRGVKSLMGEVGQFCSAHNCLSKQLEQIVYCVSFDIFEHYCRALLLQTTSTNKRNSINSNSYQQQQQQTKTPKITPHNREGGNDKNVASNKHILWRQLLLHPSSVIGNNYFIEQQQNQLVQIIESSIENLLSRSLLLMKHQDNNGDGSYIDELC